VTLGRLAALVCLAGAAALGLTACGAKKDTVGAPGTQRLSLMLDYLPNPDHAAIYAAQSQGIFRSSGLDVTIQVPSDPSAPLKLLAAGKTDLAISYEPELLLARDRGLRLVSVGALVQQPLTSIMSVGAKAPRSAAQLAGKRVGTAGISYQTAYLRTILRHAGVSPSSVTQTDVGFGLVPSMLTHKVDATLGAFWNVEGVQLARQHRHPNIVRVDQAGVPSYDELVIVARQGDLSAKATAIRRFMAALALGARTARQHPGTAVDALIRADPSLDRATQMASVTATLPTFFPSDPAHPFGWQDDARWRAYANWMATNGLIRPPTAGPPETNEFLPGQGI
jgi:putative hydroxymethylpyrimidine transport system substrate-binding protein